MIYWIVSRLLFPHLYLKPQLVWHSLRSSSCLCPSLFVGSPSAFSTIIRIYLQIKRFAVWFGLWFHTQTVFDRDCFSFLVWGNADVPPHVAHARCCFLQGATPPRRLPTQINHLLHSSWFLTHHWWRLYLHLLTWDSHFSVCNRFFAFARYTDTFCQVKVVWTGFFFLTEGENIGSEKQI